jgi:lysozyme
MHLFKQCLSIIKKWEGFRSKPYLCSSNKPTIGFGTTFYAKGMPVLMTDPEISEQAAEEILKDQLAHIWEEMDFITGNKLNGNQISALTSLAYNIGMTKFKTSTILKKVSLNPNDPTIKDEFLRWKYSQGVDRLTPRRQDEAELYFAPFEE